MPGTEPTEDPGGRADPSGLFRTCAEQRKKTIGPNQVLYRAAKGETPLATSPAHSQPSTALVAARGRGAWLDSTQPFVRVGRASVAPSGA